MKISKDRLKQLISEELSIGFSSYGPDDGGEGHEPSYDNDGRMAKQNLWKMAEYARELYELIDDEEDLEPWVEEKIAIASFMMDSVGHYMQYEKNMGQADASMASDDMEHGEEPEHDEEEFFFDPEGEEEEEYEEEYEDEDEESEEDDEEF